MNTFLDYAAVPLAALIAFWVSRAASQAGDSKPWVWFILTFFIWPIMLPVAGFKFDRPDMKMAGVLGLGFVAYLLAGDVLR